MPAPRAAANSAAGTETADASVPTQSDARAGPSTQPPADPPSVALASIDDRLSKLDAKLSSRLDELECWLRVELGGLRADVQGGVGRAAFARRGPAVVDHSRPPPSPVTGSGVRLSTPTGTVDTSASPV